MTSNPTRASASRCLFCDDTRLDPWLKGIRDRLGHVPGVWGFLRCRTCGSAILNPMPTADEIPSFYPATYGPEAPPPPGRGLAGFLARLPHTLFYQPQYDAQQRLVLRGIGWRGQRGLRCLDVGCGRGLRLAGFQRLGFQATGTDFVDGYVESVRQLGFPCHTTGFDCLTDHVGVGQFDLITAFHVFEHLLDPKAAARACWEALRPGGWLAVIVPLADSAQAEVLGIRWCAVTEAPRHITLPTAEGLVRALSPSGFTDFRILPDSVLNQAGLYGLSLFPSLTTARRGRVGPLRTLFGALVTALAVPFAISDSYLWKRPAAGMVFARKPD